MEKNRNKYNLSVREIDILYALWKAERPLLASEISEADEKLKLATVHTTLKRMLDKKVIEVADFVKSGNVFGRRYTPTITLQEFELNKLSSATSSLVSALPDNANNNFILEELNNLEQIIKEQKEKILKANGNPPQKPEEAI